jgi:ABC-2 type transport system permease protein
VSRGRVGALAARIVRGFRRDPRTLALIVVVPLVVMALIGYLISDDREPLRVAVASGEPNETCGAVVSDTVAFRAAMAVQPGIEVVEVTTCDEGRAKVQAGDLEGIVEYPVVEPKNPIATTRVIVAGTDPRVEEPIVRAATIALAAARGTPLEPGQVANVEVERVEVPGGDRPSTISYSAPALITVFAFLFTFMLTSVAFLRERSSGTLERLLASPISRSEILSGYLFGFLGFASIQALLVLAYATLVLDAKIEGALWLVLLVIAILVIGCVNLGITLSFFARNELQVIQFIPLVLLPQVFLGGLFWPTVTLWPPLQWLSALFPVTHAVRALREVMIAGGGFADVALDLAALAAFAIAMVALGILVLRGQRA